MTMLHLFCGQVASGKSTLAAQIAARPGHVLIAQDEWTRHLWPEEMRTLDDYARLIPRLRAALAPHVARLLRLGMPVVLDWPMNTPQTRAWARGIFEAAGADHILHALRPPDALRLQRLAARNAAGTHAYQVSAEDDAALARWFLPPSPEEGFNLAP